MRVPRVPRRKRTDRGREWSGSAGGTGMSPSPAAPYVNGQTGRPTKAGRGVRTRRKMSGSRATAGSLTPRQ